MSGFEIFCVVVLAIIALIIVSIFTGIQISKHRKKRAAAAQETKRKEKYKFLLGLLDRAEAGELEALDEAGGLQRRIYEYLNTEHYQRWTKVLAQLDAKVAYPENAKAVRKAFKAVKSTADLKERLEKLRVLCIAFRDVHALNFERLEKDVGISREGALQLLNEAVQQQYKALLEDRQEPSAFFELRELIARTRSRRNNYGSTYDGDLKAVGAEALSYPDDWNQLVAKHYDTPALGSFRELPERGSGDVRLLAAEAIRTGDFTNAQIALAYCNNDAKYRAAVGDVLTAELAKLVAEHCAGAGNPIVQAVEISAEQ